MGRNMVRWLGVAVLVLGGSLVAYAHDTDTDATTPFNVTLTETVRIAVTTSPGAVALTNKADLETRYFSLGSFKASVWGITNYQVSGDVDFAAGDATTALLNSGEATILVQIQATDLVGDEGDADDPESNVPNGSPYTGQALPATPGQNLWHGGNTEGGSNTFHEATVHLWLDLDQLGDQAAGNILTVTVNLLVTET
jgi:hypothetical protein